MKRYEDVMGNESLGAKILERSFKKIELRPLEDELYSWYWFRSCLKNNFSPKPYSSPWIASLPLDIFRYRGVESWKMFGSLFLDIHKNGEMFIEAVDAPNTWMEYPLKETQKKKLLEKYAYHLYAYDKSEDREFLCAFCSSVWEAELVGKRFARYEKLQAEKDFAPEEECEIADYLILYHQKDGKEEKIGVLSLEEKTDKAC